MNETKTIDAPPVAFSCDMLALSPEQRAAHQERIARLFGTLVQETRELPGGYAYRFAGEQYALLAEFIANERLCCTFLSFQLEVAPHRGPVWLQLTAHDDAKPFLREELGHYAIPADASPNTPAAGDGA